MEFLKEQLTQSHLFWDKFKAVVTDESGARLLSIERVLFAIGKGEHQIGSMFRGKQKWNQSDE